MLENKNKIPATLFEATENVDRGVIYVQEVITLNGNELIEHLRNLQANATLNLCKIFINSYPEILTTSRPQTGKASYYTKRIPKDRQIDPDKNILEQSNILRIVDNKNYPAFFNLGDDVFQLHLSRRCSEE